ncbi:MAG: hydrogenase nickel incorporation protein HypB [Candidatus Eremiobacteraeota bacterium]|nr:hydrogenase nickel incorporation protein HypB [Candidatus Eremiobacteraeota bacterium]
MVTKKISIDEKIRKGNREYAEENSRILSDHGILGVNLMSSPGSGKTSLIEATKKWLGERFKLAVIEGDLAGNLDEKRLKSAGIPVVQINTVSMCHLNAFMVNEVIAELPLSDIDILFIENIGNLVCPAGLPLGEELRVIILALTEGDDKPAKYPVIFHDADAVIINKADLLPYLDVDIEGMKKQLHAINPDVATFIVSAKNGDGIDKWVNWLTRKVKKAG